MEPIISATPRTATARDVLGGRIAGLDGLRAIAVTLVVVYHFAPGALPGGYLGVDVFFVLSGFLITSILLREHASRGSISLRRFWVHRARRLLPALVAVVVAGVAAVAIAVTVLQLRGSPVDGTLWGDLLVGVGGQLAAAATFTSNWLAVVVGQSYAAAGTPQLFAHLWSLAVEEQFYLLWPLVVLGLVAAGVRMRRAAWAALAVAVASAAAMAMLVPADADPTRVYVGTDTHAFGLMIGAALAFWWRHRAERGADWAPRRTPAVVLGAAGLAVLAALAWLMPWDALWTYRGGLLVASLAAAAVIHLVVAVPAVGRAFDVAPMRWIGERSYGIYLWHWPILVLLVAGLDGGRIHAASGLTVAVATALTLAFATASYRWLEMPVRSMGLRRSLRAFGGWVGHRRHGERRARRVIVRRAALAGGGAAGVLALVGSAVVVAPERTSLEMQLDQGMEALAVQAAAAPERPQHDEPHPLPIQAPDAGATIVPPRPAASSRHGDDAEPEAPRGRDVTMIGDSVTVGSAAALQEELPGIRIEAEVGKQFSTGADRVEALVRKDRLRPCLVVALGTNGAVGTGDIGRIMAAAGGRPVVLVTPYGDRSWIPGAQDAVRAAADRYHNVALADWQRVATRNERLIGPDGIHPTIPGQARFADLVGDALDTAGCA